jgi:hypothetical protein
MTERFSNSHELDTYSKYETLHDTIIDHIQSYRDLPRETRCAIRPTPRGDNVGLQIDLPDTDIGILLVSPGVHISKKDLPSSNNGWRLTYWASETCTGLSRLVKELDLDETICLSLLAGNLGREWVANAMDVMILILGHYARSGNTEAELQLSHMIDQRLLLEQKHPS